MGGICPELSTVELSVNAEVKCLAFETAMMAVELSRCGRCGKDVQWRLEFCACFVPEV